MYYVLRVYVWERDRDREKGRTTKCLEIFKTSFLLPSPLPSLLLCQVFYIKFSKRAQFWRESDNLDIPSHPNKYPAFFPLIEGSKIASLGLITGRHGHLGDSGRLRDWFSLLLFSSLTPTSAWLIPLPFPSPLPIRHSKFQLNQIRNTENQTLKLRGSASFTLVDNPSRLQFIWGASVPFPLLPCHCPEESPCLKTVLNGQNRKKISICLCRVGHGIPRASGAVHLPLCAGLGWRVPVGYRSSIIQNWHK